MNKRGFTLIELLATLVVLAIIAGIVLISTTTGLGNAKEKSEDVFVKTIKDALDIYLDSDARKLSYDFVCSPGMSKSHAVDNVNVYKTSVPFTAIINSTYSPISVSDMHNPANKGKDNYQCTNLDNVYVNIYRDDYNVYYYAVSKSAFNCLNGTGMVTNLPEGFSC